MRSKFATCVDTWTDSKQIPLQLNPRESRAESLCVERLCVLEHTVITNRTPPPHGLRSKPFDCLFCACADGSIKRTLGELQVRSPGAMGQRDDGLPWQTHCLARCEGHVITCDSRLWIRRTSSSVFLPCWCRFEQGSLPSVHKPGVRATVLQEEAVFNSQRLLQWSCAVVHPTPPWPTVLRTACTGAALCLTLAARAGMEWLHWPLGSGYNKWVWVPAVFARRNRAAYTVEFGLSCCEVKPLQAHTD